MDTASSTVPCRCFATNHGLTPSRNRWPDPWLWLCFGLFGVITFWAVLHHHPWRDEAQIWTTVRDLGLWDVFGQAPSEGRPPLWELLVMPLAKSGLPYASMNWLHWALVLVPVCLLLFLAPFPRPVRLLLPFSYYLLFEYSVVARPYVLTALLLFGIAALHGARFRHPVGYGMLIALLSWTTVHSIVAACVLAGWFAWDLFRQREFTWTKAVAVGIPFAAISAVPILLTPDPTQGLQYYYGWRWLLFSGAAAIWPGIQRETYRLFWPLALIWIPLALALVRGGRARSILGFSWAWLGFIFLFKHSGALNHYGLIFLYFLFTWWLGLQEQGGAALRETGIRRAAAGLCVLVVMAQAAYAAVFYLNHRGRHFSGAAEMAAYMREAGLEGQELVAYPAYIGTALLPYLPTQRIYQMEDGRTTTFMTWTLEYFQGLNMPFPDLYAKMNQVHGGGGGPEFRLLLCNDSLPPRDDWELLFENTRPSIKKDEFFRLYRITRGSR